VTLLLHFGYTFRFDHTEMTSFFLPRMTSKTSSSSSSCCLRVCVVDTDSIEEQDDHQEERVILLEPPQAVVVDDETLIHIYQQLLYAFLSPSVPVMAKYTTMTLERHPNNNNINNDSDHQEVYEYFELDRSAFWTLLGDARYTRDLVNGILLPLQQQSLLLKPSTNLQPNDNLFLDDDIFARYKEVAMDITTTSDMEELVHNLQEQTYDTEEERIQLAIDWSRRNVKERGQEPFASVIFQHDKSNNDNRTTLYAVGLNTTALHAETVALQQLGYSEKRKKNNNDNNSNDDNDRNNNMEYWMYSSCEPCCTCFGGILLAASRGILSKLVCAATKQDAESLGFDEGPIGDESYRQLQETLDLTVVRGLSREASAAVIRDYRIGAGMIQENLL
jgi:tRNA(Arg) A34 adenosine deaminase TadA